MNRTYVLIAAWAVAVGLIWSACKIVAPSFPFAHAGRAWELRIADGRLCIDNSPQRELDARLKNQFDTYVDLVKSRMYPPLQGPRHGVSDDFRFSDDGKSLSIRDSYGASNIEMYVLVARMRSPASPVPLRSYRFSLTLLLLPTIPVLAWKFWLAGRSRRRILRGICGSCGYDLRSSPCRCPECGANVSTAERPKAKRQPMR
jgi:hypothetical protein